MEFIKAKYFAFFFMLVLLTSGVPLNANNDGEILPTADAKTQDGIKIFFCENNPIKKQEYDKPHMKPQDYMSKCKERTDGYSWGSRVYVLIFAPGFNTDKHKIDELGNTANSDLVKLNSREGASSGNASTKCNPFIETGRDHGLFYGSIKLSGFKTAVNDDGKMNYGGNRCEGTGWNAQGTLDDGVLRAEAKQEGGMTLSFEYADGKMMTKSVTHTWRISELFFDKQEYTMESKGKLMLKDLDNLRYPFDKRTPYQIHVFSDTDKAGVMVDAYWKPNYRGTPQMNGDYPVSITFIDPDRRESTSNDLEAAAGGSRVELKAVPGDNIYAEYYDRTLPKPYSTEDKLLIKTVAKIVETPKHGVIVVNPVDLVEKDNAFAKQYAFTKYTSGGEYLVSVWWDSWEWWTSQPTANSDNAINISIVDGMTEKPISDVSYNVNISTDGTSVVEKQHDYTRTDVIDFSIENNGLIEVLLSDLGEATEPLKFKFMVDSELQPNAPFTQISE
jgi:hypothetical protein